MPKCRSRSLLCERRGSIARVVSPDVLLDAWDQSVDPTERLARFNLAMAAELGRFRDSLPGWARDYLRTAEQYWRGDDTRRNDLAAARQASWDYLDAKHGSALIVDDEDRLIRALLCLLYPDAEEDPGMTAAFFADMINGLDR